MSKMSPATRKSLKSRTRLVYAGREPADQHGFVNTPLYRGSTVLSPTVEHLYAREGFIYGTRGSPTMRALEEAWTELSGAAGTILLPSGLAAIAMALLAVVKSGDDILVTDSVYRPARQFCDSVLKRMGVATRYFDPGIGGAIAAMIRPNTCVVFTESPGSQSFEMQDIPAIAAAAHAAAQDICVMMDNTWATPLLFPPHERGVDMAIEAGTKYLSGHSDLLLGLVSANAAWFPRLRDTFDAMAPCAGPEDVMLALRGLRTMELRLREAERQALAMALWLQDRPEVLRVLHPALPGHPGHAIWKRDFSGSSGLFSIVLKPVAAHAVAAMLDGLELFGMGYSWGGFESLIIPFDCAGYRTATAWKPGGPTLRLQIGLEDVEDLQADLDRGFARLRNA